MIKKKQEGDKTEALTLRGVSLSDKSLSTFFCFLILGIFFSSNFVLAKNVYLTAENTEKGFIIVEPLQKTLEQNLNYTYSFFVYNESNGVLIDNSTVDCMLYIVDSNGNLIYNQNSNYTSDGYWKNNIQKNIFLELGFYSYGVKCEGGGLGGALSGIWEVTPSGKSGSSNIVFFVFVIILIYGITFISFFYGKNIPLTVLGGMAMIFLGVYTINKGIIIFRDSLTNYVSYLTIGIGFILSLWALLEQFEVI